MEKHNNSQVILSIVVGFLVLFAIFSLKWMLWAALAIGLAGLLSTTFAQFISKIWLKFAEILGRINGTILLSIIFFFFLTPIAFLMQVLSKKDELRLKQPTDSNYSNRDHQYRAEDLKNIW